VASPPVVRRLRSAAARFCEPPVFKCSRRSKFSLHYVKTNTKPGCFDVPLEHARLVFSLLSPCSLVSAIWIKVSERCPTCYFIRVYLTPAWIRHLALEVLLFSPHLFLFFCCEPSRFFMFPHDLINVPLPFAPD
jgi:hypothetical protein